MPITPVQFINAISEKIDSVKFKMKDKKNKEEVNNIFIASLEELKTKLNALIMGDHSLDKKLKKANPKAYQKEIIKLVILAYAKAYAAGRKQVYKNLRKTTFKDELILGLEEIIKDPLKFAQATPEDNFLMPTNYEELLKKDIHFEEILFSYLEDVDIVPHVILDLLSGIEAAASLEGNQRKQKIDYCVNLLKISARFSRPLIDRWNLLITKEMLSELVIHIDGKGGSKNKESTSRDTITSMVADKDKVKQVSGFISRIKNNKFKKITDADQLTVEKLFSALLQDIRNKDLTNALKNFKVAALFPQAVIEHWNKIVNKLGLSDELEIDDEMNDVLKKCGK